MGRNKKYGNITLTDDDRIDLEKLSKSQTAQYRKVQRAKILLMSASGMLNSEIAAAIGVHPNTVASIVTKYIAAGKNYALNDAPRSGKPNTISDEEMLMCGKVTQINLIDGFSRYSVKYKENRFYFSYKAAILCILRFIFVRICVGSKHSHLSPKPKSIS